MHLYLSITKLFLISYQLHVTNSLNFFYFLKIFLTYDIENNLFNMLIPEGSMSVLMRVQSMMLCMTPNVLIEMS